MEPVPEQRLLSKCNNFLSPKALPPVKFHSSLLTPHSHLLSDSDEAESVASVPEDYYANYSDSDSDLFGKPGKRSCEEEILSGESSCYEPVGETDCRQRSTLVRGFSKENLRVDVAANNSCRGDEVHILNEFMAEKFQELGTPSAPPIVGNGRESGSLNLDGETKVNLGTEVASDFATLAQKVGEIPAGYGTVQSAWQTFIAYDACFRLCLNAWARNCMEAPEFLRDECMALRNAFGYELTSLWKL
ncbi:hypothetical protein GW17_00027546 [Ensete ventricosum]|nr:hypothetical protein GW17_00027546 [Ensete ventricosum]RZS21198.1 hypothetical protein BHM03_00053806 [Ensete ventricosum]